MIRSTKQQLQSAKINAIIYGESGVGKTRLASTCPRPLVISAEGGVMSLAEFDIPYIEVTDLVSARAAVKYVTDHAQEYDTVIFDSLSEIAEIVLADMLAKTPDPRKAYPDSEAAITKLIRQLRSLPCSVIWIAKQQTGKDHLGGTTYGPMAPGTKFPEKLPYLVDIVARMAVQSIQKEDGSTSTRRVLLTETDGSFVAKDRTGRLPAVCPANIGKILDRLSGKTNGA